MQHIDWAVPEKADRYMANGNVIMCDDQSEHLPEVLSVANRNYEHFFDVAPGICNQQMIDRSRRSSGGVDSTASSQVASQVADRANREPV